jgi:hypothetical protein
MRPTSAPSSASDVHYWNARFFNISYPTSSTTIDPAYTLTVDLAQWFEDFEFVAFSKERMSLYAAVEILCMFLAILGAIKFLWPLSGLGCLAHAVTLAFFAIWSSNQPLSIGMSLFLYAHVVFTYEIMARNLGKNKLAVASNE